MGFVLDRMSLPDYYKILQVPVTASTAEIKAAYRRLAKMYHPDKNGGYSDGEKFKQIREAYETLGNPQKRMHYDSKRNRATTFRSTSKEPKKPTEKNYTFTEEDAKRRQYYQQHYKKQASAKSTAPPSQPRQSSELKYILISVPVAVALLLLMIRIYEKPNEEKIEQTTYDTVRASDIHTADSPYTHVFGKMILDTNSASVIRLINRSGHDAIVFLQNDNGKVLRSHFIENNYEMLAENIPPSTYRVFYWLGNEFSYRYFLFDTIMGNFRKSVSVDSASKQLVIKAGKRDTFDVKMANRQSPDNGGLRRIFSPK